MRAAKSVTQFAERAEGPAIKRALNFMRKLQTQQILCSSYSVSGAEGGIERIVTLDEA